MTVFKRMLWCSMVACTCSCFTGCTWIPYAVDNVFSGVTGVFHERRFRLECRELAEEAWGEICCGDLRSKRGTEFENGFKDGFVEFLDGNGDGSPPVAPPNRLRRHILRSDAEQQGIHDWFAGYRLGSQVAAQARYRDRILIPMSQPPQPFEEGYSKQVVPAGRQVGGDGGVPGVAVFEP